MVHRIHPAELQLNKANASDTETAFLDFFLLKCIVNRCKRAGYTLDIMWQTSCLAFNPIMVEGYAALFSCTVVVQALDSMTASM